MKKIELINKYFHRKKIGFIFFLGMISMDATLCKGAEIPADIPLPQGTFSLYVSDPVVPSDPAAPQGFGCFLSCGRSCECINRVNGKTTTTVEEFLCDWETVTCNTHPFCRWHDTCYRNCDITFPGKIDDGNFSRSLCYLSCDAGCSTDKEPEPLGGWPDDTLNPGPNPAQMPVSSCLRMLAHDPTLDYDGRITYAKLLGCKRQT